MDEGGEHDVQLVEAREHSSEPLELAEQPLDLIAKPVEPFTLGPLNPAVLRQRSGWVKTKIHRKLESSFPFVLTVHDQGNRCLRGGQLE